MTCFTDTPPPPLLGLVEILAGLAFFPLLFHVAAALLKVVMVPRWPESVALDIANKAVSAVFAFGACACGFSVLRNCGSDVMSESHPLVRHYMSFGLTYFLYDIYSMNVVFQAERREAAVAKGEGEAFKENVWAMVEARWIMVMHHLLLPIVGYPTFTLVQNSIGDCLIACGFLMEASTPFVSLRAILARLDLKTSPVYVLNGLAMNVVFFFCRILVFPYIYYRFAGQLGKSVFVTATQHVPIVCNVSMATLFAPQLYWFGLMVKGSVKVIKGFNGRSKPKEE